MKTESVGTRAKDTRKCYHYTTGRCLSQIVADGVVRQATTGVPAGERAASWWSFNEAFDPTAYKMIGSEAGVRIATFDEMIELDGGVFRIAVEADTVPLKWNDWRRQSGCRSKTVKQLEEHALRRGARIEEWRATFNLVLAGEWIAVERWSDGCWERDAEALRSAQANQSLPKRRAAGG
jgi:hypothetical protein